MYSVMRLVQIGAMLGIVPLLVLASGAVGKNVAPCPSGWHAFEDNTTTTCLLVGKTRKFINDATRLCRQMNASLIRMETDAKYEKFQAIAKTKDKGLWIPLIKTPTGFKWLTKDGAIPATSLPKGLQGLRLWYKTDHGNNKNGLIYRHPDHFYRWDQLGTYPYYVCEKRANCTKGWFGQKCDKQCHCYAQDCDPLDVEVTCQYGCERGWMGKGCSKPKEDAVVRYFCVNSPDQGKYAHLRIYTKGVLYENIHAVDSKGKWISWCDSTVIQMDSARSVMTIKVYINKETKSKMQNGSCAGMIARNGMFEWQIRIQEKAGIVLKNDQHVHLECNFDGGDRFTTNEKAEIERESCFMRSDIRRPIMYLDEMQESVVLALVDPATGKPLSGNLIGSAVVLKLTFAAGPGDIATGVIPYNCYASTPDKVRNATFLDDNGCPSDFVPISPFHKNESNTLITDPFNLFGFDGVEEVEFHCSYVLCFDDEPCPVGCLLDNQGAFFNDNISRRRRSAEAATSFKMMEKTGAQVIKDGIKSP